MGRSNKEWEILGLKIFNAAKNELYLSMRYLYLALDGLEIVADMRVDFLATDGGKLYFLPMMAAEKYMENPLLINRAYLHSVLHCLFGHMYKREKRDEDMWNLACDIMVEGVIDDMEVASVTTVVPPLKEEAEVRIARECKIFSAEYIYDYLKKNKEDILALENYFKVDDGLGSMAHIQRVQINIYFRHKKNGKSITTSTNLVSTEEVLQMTNFSNDNTRLQQLANETGHTYLKTPAGLFTQLTIPMSDIMAGHRNDSVNSAKIILYRQNNTSESAYHFNIPKNLVMLPSDSLQSFFANNRIPDNKTSFLATYNSTTNSYVFNNISGIVNLFMRHTNSANWGKVVVVPVELQTVTQGTGNNQQTKITKVSHEMGLTSTKLLGNSPGRNNIEISVIYSRFNGR